MIDLKTCDYEATVTGLESDLNVFFWWTEEIVQHDKHKCHASKTVMRYCGLWSQMILWLNLYLILLRGPVHRCLKRLSVSVSSICCCFYIIDCFAARSCFWRLVFIKKHSRVKYFHFHDDFETGLGKIKSSSLHSSACSDSVTPYQSWKNKLVNKSIGNESATVFCLFKNPRNSQIIASQMWLFSCFSLSVQTFSHSVTVNWEILLILYW